MLRAMANQFGGDPAATDSTRVFACPDSRTENIDEEFIVQAHTESNADLPRARFHRPGGFARDSPRHLRDECRDERLPQGHRSQSEQDWAYAKRALARGDDPELVIRESPIFAPKISPIRITTHGIPS